MTVLNLRLRVTLKAVLEASIVFDLVVEVYGSLVRRRGVTC